MASNEEYRVLIVDDDPAVLKTISFVLKKEGYGIVNAINGTDAIDKAKTERPSMIIMDFRMPDMDGWEAAKKIRELDYCRLIPIIGYTAYATEETRNVGFSHGLNEILMKPLDIDELRSIVADYKSRSSILEQ